LTPKDDLKLLAVVTAAMLVPYALFMLMWAVLA
jgi:hypothetical protein